MTKPLVGLFINPMAGRDIRRLVAHAAMTTGPAKRLAMMRIAAGVRAAGAGLLVADDQEGLGRAVVQDNPEAELLPSPMLYGPDLTREWVRDLEDQGARVLIAVGGDGTQRVVASQTPGIPVLPVGGGTNNVVCWTGDETAAGLAAGRVAMGQPSTARPAKLIHVERGQDHEVALVDVAHIQRAQLGAAAVWDSDAVLVVLLTLADPVRPGLSSPGGQVRPVAAVDDWGIQLRMAPPDHPGRNVQAVVAPGLVQDFRVMSSRRVALDRPVVWRNREAATLAFDGEREMLLAPGDTVRLTIRRDGPRLLDPGEVLRPRRRRV